MLVIVSVMVGVTCFGFLSETFTTLCMNHTVSQQRSIEGRVDATRIAWEMWKERHLVGAGTGNYTLAADHKPNQDSTRTYTSYAPNPEVLILVEGGILGMMLFVFLLMAVCRVLVRRHKEKDVLLVGVILLALFVRQRDDIFYFAIHSYVHAASFYPAGCLVMGQESGRIHCP